MALKPKTDLLQIRVEPRFLAELKAWSDYEERPLSDLVRRVLMGSMESFKNHLARKRLELRDGVLVELPPESRAVDITNAYNPAIEVEGVVSDDSDPQILTRQQRRAKERDEKKGR